ncbi:GCN5-like N-acetyltransferase [Oceaniovalibus guishaninsula JLT2003]|uniref:GCN5-like N-acetyltransferase n=1 Tax=Oceaniovalibus guishaninsula JLT2003 TaxID=1231392 RepID=K2HMW4_9RHOB|nr:GNAT family N-acetyltransferase [Oceaniovalibus guishaninsula]EKE44164.1 GCN5-like N-acetyltransferase [Oceaniovalibus guishaninsula JLT2003]
MPIEMNALETDRFGVPCARIADPAAPLDAIDAAARAQGVRMLSTRIDVSNLPRVHALESDGFRLMDTLVYYGRSLTDWTEPAPRRPFDIRRARPQDADAVEAVARSSFKGYYGHYHADPRLDNDKADAAYVEWSGNSIRALTDRLTAAIVTVEDEIVAYATLRFNTDIQAEMVVGGVAPHHQGGGLYAAMVARSLSFMRDDGATEFILSTQINNYAVQKVWARFGLAHRYSYYTFHKWFD